MKKNIGFRGFPIGAKPISPRESGPLQEALDPSFRPHLKPPETMVFFFRVPNEGCKQTYMTRTIECI